MIFVFGILDAILLGELIPIDIQNLEVLEFDSFVWSLAKVVQELLKCPNFVVAN